MKIGRGKMKYTGERIIPDAGELYSLFKHHLSLYEFAACFAKDKVVLDVGCGEGYGANLLAEQAKKVMAVDGSQEAIEHARGIYLKDNLEYRAMDAAQLDFTGGSFDLVVAIELIEHLKEYRKFLDGVCRVLSSSGIFILSTPRLNNASSGHLAANPYHVNEFTLSEFADLLHEYFYTVEILGVKIKGAGLKDFLKKIDIFKLRKKLSAETRVKILRQVDKNISFEIKSQYVKKGLSLVGVCHKPKI